MISDSDKQKEWPPAHWSKEYAARISANVDKAMEGPPPRFDHDYVSHLSQEWDRKTTLSHHPNAAEVAAFYKMVREEWPRAAFTEPKVTGHDDEWVIAVTVHRTA
jgi:hypothetical protein